MKKEIARLGVLTVLTAFFASLCSYYDYFHADFKQMLYSAAQNFNRTFQIDISTFP